MKVVKRDGSEVVFISGKIKNAIIKAYKATDNGVFDLIKVDSIMGFIFSRLKNLEESSDIVEVETIQDLIEEALMRGGDYRVAKAFVIYRDERRKQRENCNPLNESKGAQFKSFIDSSDVLESTVFQKIKDKYKTINIVEFYNSMVLESRALIANDYSYTFVASKFLKKIVDTEVNNNIGSLSLSKIIFNAADKEILAPEMTSMNMLLLEKEIKSPKLTYQGAKTLYDRYLLRDDAGNLIETYEVFFMRVAMGLALKDTHREESVIKFYKSLVDFNFMCSTPTLFNSGRINPQLASCFVSTTPDSLEGIYDSFKESAIISKHAGGVGSDWSNVRSSGALIRSTKGKSQGIIPFLKVLNDTMVACDQSGKRKGSGCVYIEPWHLDINNFLELRKDTGDDRRRTHDLNIALWVPDEFMARVRDDKDWYLFCPDSAPNLHNTFGEHFSALYCEYIDKFNKGLIRGKKVRAKDLWIKILTALFETGHPWLVFKDNHNRCNTQAHYGIINSSNLCTEISLPTSYSETAVCNLGSINVANHLDSTGSILQNKLEESVYNAVRALDNVITLNYYPSEKAKVSNFKHRPIGLGILGLHTALLNARIPIDSERATEIGDEFMESVAYYATAASILLAKERSEYLSYAGSSWSRGVFPKEFSLSKDTTSKRNWGSLKDLLRQYGIRNSKLLAIAPTATISNICGVSQSIEPIYQNIYIKSNLSGNLPIVNQFLQADLEKLGRWNHETRSIIKNNRGSLKEVKDLPNELYRLYKTAFEVDMLELIKSASRKQKWVDQAISLNLYLEGNSGVELSNLYFTAWELGLKSTYYLRTLAKSEINKTTTCSLEEGCESCQ